MILRRAKVGYRQVSQIEINRHFLPASAWIFKIIFLHRFCKQVSVIWYGMLAENGTPIVTKAWTRRRNSETFVRKMGNRTSVSLTGILVHHTLTGRDYMRKWNTFLFLFVSLPYFSSFQFLFITFFIYLLLLSTSHSFPIKLFSLLCL